MSTTAVLVGTGAIAGGVVGAGFSSWLRAGGHRLAHDTPRLPLRWAWLVVPASVVLGGIAGGVSQPWLLLTTWLYLPVAAGLAWIDVDVHRVPNRVLAWWGPWVGLCVLLAAIDGHPHLAVGGVLGAAAYAGVTLTLAIFGSMGWGDVKLAAVTGLVLGACGWDAVLWGAVATIVAAFLGCLARLVRGADRSSHLAFAPAMIAGSTVAIAATAFLP